MSDEAQREVELDVHAQAMLASLRAQERLPDEVSSRVWSRVSSTLRRRRTARLMVPLLAAAAIALLLLGARMLDRAPGADDPRGMQAPYRVDARGEQGRATIDRGAPAGRSEPVPAPEVREPPEDATPQSDSEADAPGDPPSGRVEASPRRRVPPQPAAVPEPHTPSPDPPRVQSASLAEETRLLKRAHAARAAGDPRRALAVLDESLRRFPRGMLAEERAALRAMALCDAGDREAGPATAAFLRRYPGSALASRVRGACGP